MRARSRSLERVAALLGIAICGCRGGSRDRKGGNDTPNVAATGARVSSGAQTSNGVNGVKTAARPASACEWLPVAQVEAILGPLAGPPTGKSLSCRFPLPLD